MGIGGYFFVYLFVVLGSVVDQLVIFIYYCYVVFVEFGFYSVFDVLFFWDIGVVFDLFIKFYQICFIVRIGQGQYGCEVFY